MMKLNFDIYDPRGVFPIIDSELETISNKLESGDGVNVQGYTFYRDMDDVQRFKYQYGIFDIFVDGLAMPHDMIATVTRTAESNISKEAAKEIDMVSELEAVIT